MRIALCDDDLTCLKQLSYLVQKLDSEGSIKCYFDISLFFADLRSGIRFDLVMMDLDWGQEEDGLNYAEQLYHIEPQIPVIFVTGYNDRFSQYVLLKKSNLAGYLTKPVDESVLKRYLQKVAQQVQNFASLVFCRNGLPISIPVQEILYLESSNHTCLIHTKSDAYPVYEKLSEILLRLPDCFVQCHKSYAVNMQWIQRMAPDSILLTSGKSIQISRSFKATAKGKVLKYLELQL